MSFVSREVRDGEKGCRICERFDARLSCWQRVENFGDDCEEFERNLSIKRVVDDVEVKERT